MRPELILNPHAHLKIFLRSEWRSQMNIVTLIALVVFIEAFLHYCPWRLILGGKDLPRVIAYMLGVLGLMVPFTAWLIENGELIIVRTLWLVIISGGLSVMVAY